MYVPYVALALVWMHPKLLWDAWQVLRCLLYVLGVLYRQSRRVTPTHNDDDVEEFCATMSGTVSGTVSGTSSTRLKNNN